MWLPDPQASISRIGLAGTPPLMVFGATSLVTTDPAATIAPSPMRTPGTIVEFAPTHTRGPITTGFGSSRSHVQPVESSG